MDWLYEPWPWWIGGPLIGLVVPALLFLDNRSFGVSSSMRHLWAAVAPGRSEFLRYDWKERGIWNLVFVGGTALGGFLGAVVFPFPEPMRIAADTVVDLRALGIDRFESLVPTDLIAWAGLGTVPGWILLGGGGFCVGFGARYAGGCTSGHAITGLANLQPASLVAVVGFFVGGLITTYLVLPGILG